MLAVLLSGVRSPVGINTRGGEMRRGRGGAINFEVGDSTLPKVHWRGFGRAWEEKANGGATAASAFCSGHDRCVPLSKV